MDKEFYKLASLNNTFNLEAVEKALNEIQVSSFQYLTEIQMKTAGVKRFDFNMGDIMYTERVNIKNSYYPRRWVMNIPENFIADNRRSEFRESQFYNKFITYHDVIQNPEIFTNTFLLFVNGAVYTNAIEIMCKEDTTVMIFRVNEIPGTSGINYDVMKELIETNAPATFLILDMEISGFMKTNQYLFAKYNNVVPISDFQIYTDKMYKNKFMVSVSNIGDIQANLCITDNTATDIYFLNNFISESGYKEFIIDAFLPKNIDSIKYISGSEEWFTIEEHECPVATSNILVFNKNTKEFMHNIKLELYYPNIYHIVGNVNKDDLMVYVFYYDDTSEKLLEYRNHLEVYYRYTSNVLEKYKNKSILNIIKNYMPIEVDYTIKNFKETVYFDDHFKFKSEYLRELIQGDGNHFRTYLKYQCGRPHTFYLYVKNLNLETRIRQNNSDVRDRSVYEEFDELRYLFIFRNEFKGAFTDILFTIDGLAYIPDKYYHNNKYDYYYIPMDMLNEDSIIEVEKIRSYSREELIKFNDINQEITIKIDENLKARHNDIYLTDADNGVYLEPEDYTIFGKLDDEWVELGTNSFYEINGEYKVKLNNPDYIGLNLRSHIKKKYTRVTQTLSNEHELLSYAFDMPKDPDFIRVYRNGRMIPRRNTEYIFNSNKTNGRSYINYTGKKEFNDTFIIEQVPYKMKSVYFKRFIDTNTVINLYGIIDKPIDLRWYDLYLNGRKLTKENVEIISPCKIILRNVQSIRNFEIIQNDRDESEWYGFFTPTDIIDKILEREDFITPPDNSADEGDEIGDENDTEESLIYDFWINFLSLFGFINPDWSQIPRNVAIWYDELLQKPNNVFLIQPDRGADTATKHMQINPDATKPENSPSLYMSASQIHNFLRSF